MTHEWFNDFLDFLNTSVLKFISGVLGAFGYSVVSIGTFRLLKDRGVGHRVALWVTSIVFLIKTIVSVFGAWQAYHSGNPKITALVYLAGGFAFLFFAAQVVAGYRDVKTILKGDVAQDRIRRHLARNIAQQQSDTHNLSTSAMRDSAHLVEIQKERVERNDQ